MWSAAYDNSVPLDLHIDSIGFYLANQDGKRVNLQGNQFQISLRIGWPDPAQPPLGSAGAENRLPERVSTSVGNEENFSIRFSQPVLLTPSFPRPQPASGASNRAAEAEV